MPLRPIVPKELKAFYDDWKMSPGILSGDHIFLTGFTGAGADGSLAENAETQMRNAFEKIGFVLRDAGLDFGSWLK